MRTVLDCWQVGGKRTCLVVLSHLARGNHEHYLETEKIVGFGMKESVKQLAVKEVLAWIVHLEALETFAVETHWERGDLKCAVC